SPTLPLPPDPRFPVSLEPSLVIEIWKRASPPFALSFSLTMNPHMPALPASPLVRRKLEARVTRESGIGTQGHAALTGAFLVPTRAVAGYGKLEARFTAVLPAF